MLESNEALISEQDVLKRWPVLSGSKLLGARKSGRIAWVRGKRGAAWYRASAVEIFIAKELEQPCRDPGPEIYLRSADSGSPKSLADQGSIASGMTPALAERAALASARRILKPQKTTSRKSS
jgi:hypothetical protein